MNIRQLGNSCSPLNASATRTSFHTFPTDITPPSDPLGTLLANPWDLVTLIVLLSFFEDVPIEMDNADNLPTLPEKQARGLEPTALSSFRGTGYISSVKRMGLSWNWSNLGFNTTLRPSAIRPPGWGSKS